MQILVVFKNEYKQYISYSVAMCYDSGCVELSRMTEAGQYYYSRRRPENAEDNYELETYR